MKRFLIYSAVLHIALFLMFTLGNLTFLFPHPPINQTNTIKVEFLDKIPTNKSLTQPILTKPKDKPKPKKEKKETSPPPKPVPGIKTKAKAPEPTKKQPQKEEPKKVTSPKTQPKPKKDPIVLKKKKKTPPPKAKEKKVQETTKKQPKQDPKQSQVEKTSEGIEKKKQEVESVDALLNTLLPDVGGTRDENAKALKEPDASEMPEYLENEAVHEIRSQIEAVWNYNPTEGIDFHLYIKIDPSGRILNVVLSSTENQNALQKAAAEAAYRAALRLEQFDLKPNVFKPEYHKDGWDEIDVHFHPRS